MSKTTRALLCAPALYLAASLQSPFAGAATNIASINVSATVVAECQVSVTGARREAYIAAHLSASPVSVRCDNLVSYNVSESADIPVQSTNAIRPMVVQAPDVPRSATASTYADRVNGDRKSVTPETAETRNRFFRTVRLNPAADALNLAPAPYTDAIRVIVTY